MSKCLKTSVASTGRYMYGASHYVHVHVHVVGLYYWWMLALLVYWMMELAYGTQSTVTPVQFSDLGWFVVSRLFLGIPVLLHGALS